MDQHRAIPPGYMTVGQLAKKMNTTVRTLQYYDKQGLLSPSAESGGGRRLYTDKDVIQLHQIQSLKFLGFSLDDIKNRLVALETPAQVAEALAGQAELIRTQITSLSQALGAIEALESEVLAMDSVDFRKYAAIIVSLQIKNEYYGLIKHFDDETLEQFTNRFSGNQDGAAAITQAINAVLDKAIQFQKDGLQPESEDGQKLAKEFWDAILEVTGGDTSLIPMLAELVENADDNGNWKKKQDIANCFIEPALGAYFDALGINPFEQEETT